jgi:hypothetical protein
VHGNCAEGCSAVGDMGNEAGERGAESRDAIEGMTLHHPQAMERNAVLREHGKNRKRGRWRKR